MVSSSELFNNPNFLTKFCITIILSPFINFISRYYAHKYIVIGYSLSCDMGILTLLFAYILFEPTKITEMCLLIVTLIKLLIGLIFFTLQIQPTTETVTTPEPMKDKEPGDTQYYIFLVIYIVGIILITLDIFLRAFK